MCVKSELYTQASPSFNVFGSHYWNTSLRTLKVKQKQLETPE